MRNMTKYTRYIDLAFHKIDSNLATSNSLKKLEGVLEISLQTSHNFKMLRHQPADSRPSAGCRLLRCDAGSESLINMLPLKLPIKLTRSLWLDHTTRRVSDNRLKYVSLAVKFKQNISKRFRKCCVD